MERVREIVGQQKILQGGDEAQSPKNKNIAKIRTN